MKISVTFNSLGESWGAQVCKDLNEEIMAETFVAKGWSLNISITWEFARNTGS